MRHPVNLGQGAALQTGFAYALSDPRMRHVITFDADGQHQVPDAEAMLGRARRGDADVVFGSRFLDERTRASGLKRLVLRLAVGYTNLTTGPVSPMPTTACACSTGRSWSGSTSPRTGWPTPPRSWPRSARCGSTVHRSTYTEEPVHILYTDYSRAKGQSVLNAVNILAELIWR